MGRTRRSSKDVVKKTTPGNPEQLKEASHHIGVLETNPLELKGSKQERTAHDGD